MENSATIPNSATAPIPPSRRAVNAVNAVTAVTAVTTCTDPACRQHMLRCCPVVRMGKVFGTAYQSATDDSDYVIPPDLCIGCGICAAKCTHGLTRMVEW